MRSKLFFSAAGAALLAAFGAMGAASAQSASANDPGDSSATAARIAGGQTVTGQLSPAGDKDWYRLSVRTGQIYRIAMDGAETGGVDDTLLRVVAADGTELARNDDGPGRGLNSFLEYVPTRNGDVFIEARGLSDTATGAYTLHVEAGPMPPDPASGDVRTRARIALGATLHEGLDFSGDKDWYRIHLDQGHAYRFALAGDGAENALADPKLRILDAHGEEVGSDDDGGGGLNSFLEFTAPSTGDYFVEAAGFGDDATGKYVLSANAGDIPGDTTTDLTLSAEGDTRQGLLSPGGDSDWYRVTLKSGQSMRVALNSGSENGLDDPLLVLHGPDGKEISRDDDGGPGLNSRLEFIAPADGVYYLEARGFGDTATGRYSIELTAGEIPNVADGAESLEANGEGMDSVIAPAGDKDWFGIDLVEGRPYRFGVEAAEENGLTDPVLTLFDENGKEIASDDDGGTGANAYLNFVSPTGGRYYAQVSGAGDATGHYHVHVSDTDVPGNTSTDETLNAEDGDDRTSAIEIPGDLDNYKVSLKAGVHYIINVAGAGDRPLTDPFLAILNDEGTSITTDDDSGPGSDARIDFVAQKDGDFFLQASGNGGSVGGYKISIARRGS